MYIWSILSLLLMKKLLSLLLSGVLLLSSLPVLAEEDIPEMKPVPNMILQTKEQMLANRDGVEAENLFQQDDFRFSTVSNLSIDRSGGFRLLTSRRDFELLDVLTGRASIEDSMQIGNYGSDFETDRQALRSIEEALESYKRNAGTGEYPESLEDFREYGETWWAGMTIGGERKNVADAADIVVYEPVKTLVPGEDCTYVTSSNCREDDHEEVTSYNIRLVARSQNMIPFSEVTAVETESHDFETMIREEGIEFEIPEIAQHIPADMLMVHFQDAAKYGEFFAAVSHPLSELTNVLPLPDASDMEALVADRLGIPDPQKFLSLVDEFAFVSEDIQFFPRTDFALIVRFKDEGSELLASMFENGENAFGEAGDYYVFATHEGLLKKIQNTEYPLADELDFHYTLGILDERRDGMIYLSDAFLRKMVSPEYRINKRRQNTILDALEALQYASWAYKDIEGVFPTSITDFEEKGYFAKNMVFESEKYTIDEDGVVSHAVWGSLFEPTPVSRVAITEVSEREKIWYEEGRDIYQMLYREFFDPVGIAIMVSDKIAFHTVILPLSDSEEYEIFRAIVGDAKKVRFDFLENPRRGAMLKMVFGFDLNRMAYMIMREEMGSDYDEIMATENPKATLLQMAAQEMDGEEFTEAFEKMEAAETVEEAITIVAEEMFRVILEEELDITWDGPIFDLFGDEVMLGGSLEGMPTLLDNDAYAAVRLKDPEKAEELIDLFAKKILSEMSREVDTGLLASGSRLNRTEYNGEEYVTVPFLFTINLYYTIIDDRLYGAISATAIKNIIDRKDVDETAVWERNLDFLSGPKNALAVADLNAVANLFNTLDVSPRLLSDALHYQVVYLSEYQTLAQILEDSNAAASYYKHMPMTFFDAHFDMTDDGVFFVNQEERTDVRTINFARYRWDETPGMVSAQDLTAKVGATELVQETLRNISDGGLSFAFTEHGAEIRISFNNSGNDVADERFDISKEPDPFAEEEDNTQLYLFLGIGICVLLLFFSLVYFSQKKKK